MLTVEQSRSTPHSLALVWETLSAFNQIERFHPSVVRSPGTERKDFAVGASRVCHFEDGSSIKEVVTRLTVGQSIDIELSQFSMPFKSANARFSVRPTRKGCRITFHMRFLPKYGFLGTLAGHLVIKSVMARMMKTVLAGLDDYLVQLEIGANTKDLRLAALPQTAASKREPDVVYTHFKNWSDGSVKSVATP